MRMLYYDLFLSPDSIKRSVLEIPKVNKPCSQFENAPKKKITLLEPSVFFLENRAETSLQGVLHLSHLPN